MSTLAALALVIFARQETDWKKDWQDAQKKAKDGNKLALLYFYNGGIKNCVDFDKDVMSKPEVRIALQPYICCKIDPDHADDVDNRDNKLWQQNKSPMPPAIIVFEPDGTKLTMLNHTGSKYVPAMLEKIPRAYYDKLVPARQALAKNADDPDALCGLGEAWGLMDDLAQSTNAFKKAMESTQKKGDTAATIKVIRAQFDLYIDMDRPWQAALRPAARKLLELDPNDSSKLGAKAAWADGLAAIMERKFQEAIAILKPACDKYKDSDMLCDLMMWLATAYANAKDNDNALKVFDQIVEKFPGTQAATKAKQLAAQLRK